ncbi:hypothetical protein ACFC2F_21040 [Enterobacter sichuanensis]|uniref:hypothetical protein n=1 Tax=Enterobacter sichuanensis TaxID=2071710 RepID=UPI0036D2821E
MAMGGFCNITGFIPSQRTVEALRKMEEISRSASILTTLLAGVPLFQIFAGRGDYIGLGSSVSAYNIATYDWEKLQLAFRSIQDIQRRKLLEIVIDAQTSSTGEDRMFWRCMDHAL